MDAMSHALRRAIWSPFSRDIERAPISSRFTQPPFNSYDGKIDPVEHVSHYIQMMSLHTHNDALMCKVFPSSLGPIALRWFYGLRKDSIHSFSELIQKFGVRFMTCSPWTHCYQWKWGLGKPSTVMLTGTGSYTTRLAKVMKKSRWALFGWGCPRISNYETRWQKGLLGIWGSW